MGGVFATHADGSTSRARPVFRFGLWVRMSVAHGDDEVVREADYDWVYELELDDACWVPMDALLRALRDLRRWRDVQRDDLVSMVASSAKRRYEIDGDRIRALYGHSVPGHIAMVRADLPEVLFHGTSPAAWESIRERGLSPRACHRSV